MPLCLLALWHLLKPRLHVLYSSRAGDATKFEKIRINFFESLLPGVAMVLGFFGSG